MALKNEQSIMTNDIQPNLNTADDPQTETLHGKLAEALAPVAPLAARAASLRERLAARVAQSAARHRGLHTFRREDARWKTLAQGVRACVLHDAGHSRSAIVEFAPGSQLPSHRHAEHEECIVLQGSLHAGDMRVGLHDYHLAPAGSRHASIHSREGAVAFLRGTSIGNTSDMMREMAAALLPGDGEQPFTIAWNNDGWREISAGAQIKPLWHAGDAASFLLRLAAGTRVTGHPHPFDEECLMLSGEAFFGDVLLRPGEYQLAPKGLTHGEAYSDVGALIYVHGDARYLQP
jgi:quercetin dioxygenase-like cupin family protein